MDDFIEHKTRQHENLCFYFSISVSHLLLLFLRGLYKYKWWERNINKIWSYFKYDMLDCVS